jgi:creatinine amidohydrolase
VRSIARHGPRRFYALNTGVSTARALEPARLALAAEGIVFRYTDVLEALGTHADEIETSLMLVIAPDRVDMKRAVKDYAPSDPTRPGLTRTRDGNGTFSPTGTWGDPTLATRAKGERLVAAFLEALVIDFERLQSSSGL